MNHPIRDFVLATLVLVAVLMPRAGATLSVGPWVPLFRGVDHAMGTNTPGDGLPNLHVAYLIRVDLQDPDVRLFSSPRLEDYAAGSRETGGYTVSDFLAKHRLQVAVNAGLFAVALLARNDRKLAVKLEAFRRKQTRAVLDAELPPLA